MMQQFKSMLAINVCMYVCVYRHRCVCVRSDMNSVRSAWQSVVTFGLKLTSNGFERICSSAASLVFVRNELGVCLDKCCESETGFCCQSFVKNVSEVCCKLNCVKCSLMISVLLRCHQSVSCDDLYIA